MLLLILLLLTTMHYLRGSSWGNTETPATNVKELPRDPSMIFPAASSSTAVYTRIAPLQPHAELIALLDISLYGKLLALVHVYYTSVLGYVYSTHSRALPTQHSLCTRERTAAGAGCYTAASCSHAILHTQRAHTLGADPGEAAQGDNNSYLRRGWGQGRYMARPRGYSRASHAACSEHSGGRDPEGVPGSAFENLLLKSNFGVQNPPK